MAAPVATGITTPAKRFGLLGTLARAPVTVFLLALGLLISLVTQFDLPFVGYSFAGALVFQVAIRPQRRELSASVVSGLVFLLCRWIVQPGWSVSLSTVLGALGVGSFFVLFVLAVWTGEEQRRSIRRALFPALLMAWFNAAGRGMLLNLPGAFNHATYDLYLFLFDGSLGFQPSCLVGRWYDRYSWLYQFGKITYEGLVLAMVLFYAAYARRERSTPWFVMELYLLAGLLAYFISILFGATGPIYAFPAFFPHHPPLYEQLRQLVPQRVFVPDDFPRNAIPSLHLTFALQIWHNSRGLSRTSHVLAFLVLLATLFDTLGTGEHYLVDLVVAVPFTLMVQALCQHEVSWRTPIRSQAAAFGFAMTTVWLFALRYGSGVFLLSRFLPWAMVVASTVASFWLLRALGRSVEPSRTTTDSALQAGFHQA